MDERWKHLRILNYFLVDIHHFGTKTLIKTASSLLQWLSPENLCACATDRFRGWIHYVNWSLCFNIQLHSAPFDYHDLYGFLSSKHTQWIHSLSESLCWHHRRSSGHTGPSCDSLMSLYGCLYPPAQTLEDLCASNFTISVQCMASEGYITQTVFYKL